MIDVEAVELAVGDQVDSRLLLRRDHDARRVDERLLRRRAREPVGSGYEPTTVVRIRFIRGL